MNSPVTPPPPFRQPAPDRVVIREGGGCLSIFGTPFLAAGVLTTLIGLQVVPVSNRDDVPSWAWPLIFLMGAAFVAVGVNLVFGRRWTTLDRGKGLIIRQSGLMFPTQSEQRPLSDFDGVRMRFEEGDADTADRYPVALTGKAGRPDQLLTSPVDYAAARDQAEFVADFLCLPYVDATTDHETVVTTGSGTTDPVGKHASFAPGNRAARPPFMRSEVDQSRGRVRIVIPGPGFRPQFLLGFALPVFFVWFFVPELLEFFDRTHTPAYVQTFFAGFILLFFGLLPAIGTINGIIRSIRGRTTVDASAEGIRIEEQGAWRRRATVLPVGEIFGIDYSSAENSLSAYARVRAARRRRTHPAGTAPPSVPGGPPPWLRRLVKSKGVQVKCRQGIVAFGGGLPDGEVRYLYALVKGALRENMR